MKREILILAFICMINLLFSQTFVNYNGSLVGLVNTIVTDKQGYVWIGSNNCVSKFDGTNWTKYTTADGLSNNEVLSIAADTLNNIWIGTANGVTKYDGINWTIYSTANSVPLTHVLSIAIDSQGNKWFGTFYSGVFKFDGLIWTTYTTTNGLANNCVYSIAIDSLNNKWFGTDGYVSKFDGTNWSTYTLGWISSIVIDNGNIWFATNSLNGVSIYDGLNWTTFTTSNGLAINSVHSIAIDNNENIWFGYGEESYGVTKYNRQSCIRYTTQDGLINNDITTITKDHQGNIWFGSKNGGVSMLKNQNSINNYKRSILDFNIYPNPFNDKIIIETSNVTSATYCSLLNIQGQVLLKKHIAENKTQIDLDNLYSGVFFVKIISDRVVDMKKIIKE